MELPVDRYLTDKFLLSEQRQSLAELATISNFVLSHLSTHGTSNRRHAQFFQENRKALLLLIQKVQNSNRRKEDVFYEPDSKFQDWFCRD
ncbi:hypothetical protein TNIN_151081 [Trichonephila inaurata madagascariensis]|uniref:Uncharacterized protein n=1 Tax=Trichonephila inaurata madagascariensis TaxID=2747483 RepID=A0A8X6XZS4_9ARAC|nr:hypothetical protein TNIN_151081 [Trichonephila inaurata madagascariensis]